MGEVRKRMEKAARSLRCVVYMVVCDRNMPGRLEAKIYKSVVRPVMIYGAVTWALRNEEEEERKLQPTEMRMLRWDTEE